MTGDCRNTLFARLKTDAVGALRRLLTGDDVPLAATGWLFLGLPVVVVAWMFLADGIRGGAKAFFFLLAFYFE